MGGVKATAPRVLNLNTRWRWVVSFTPRPPHPRRKKKEVGWAPQTDCWRCKGQTSSWWHCPQPFGHKPGEQSAQMRLASRWGNLLILYISQRCIVHTWATSGVLECLIGRVLFAVNGLRKTRVFHWCMNQETSLPFSLPSRPLFTLLFRHFTSSIPVHDTRSVQYYITLHHITCHIFRNYPI
jgi:hypothetical protein